MNDRKLHIEKYQAKLAEWKADLDKLKAKAEGSSADAKLRANKNIHTLEKKTEAAKKKLAELRESSDDAWDKVKDGAEDAWKSLSSAFESAVSEFRK